MNRKMLIIDDDVIIQKMLARFLERIGYIVATADCVADGIDIAKQIQPDAICCDMMMPNQSGIDLVRLCQADKTLKQIPIIIISGSGLPEMVTEAMALGAFAYLGKPFTQSELQSVVESAFASKQESDTN